MTSPSDLTDETNWTGGYYELAIRLGPTDDADLERAIRALWRLTPIDGCSAVVVHDPIQIRAVTASIRSFDEHLLLRGRIDIPPLGAVVCAVETMRFDGGTDWLNLLVPLGALERIDARIAGFPFGEAGGSTSLAWRRPIDDWLATVATRMYRDVNFQLAVIGFEAPAFGTTDEPDVEPRSNFAFVESSNGELRYTPATT
jgi:hypothetical protein